MSNNTSNINAHQDGNSVEIEMLTFQVSKAESFNPNKNFTVEEDLQLCSSYMFISTDAIHGNEQKSDTFWSKISDHYKGFLSELVGDRNTRALTNRWYNINKAVNKFSGIMSQLRAANQSGANEELLELKAKAMYKAEMKLNFTAYHCYRYLSRYPKWQETAEKSLEKQKNKGKGGMKKSMSVAVEGQQQDDDGTSDMSGTRPAGRKQMKARESGVRRFEEMMEEMHAMKASSALELKERSARILKSIEDQAEEQMRAAKARQLLDEEEMASFKRRRLLEEEEIASAKIRRQINEEELASAKTRRDMDEANTRLIKINTLIAERKLLSFDASSISNPAARKKFLDLQPQVMEDNTDSK